MIFYQNNPKQTHLKLNISSKRKSHLTFKIKSLIGLNNVTSTRAQKHRQYKKKVVPYLVVVILDQA